MTCTSFTEMKGYRELGTNLALNMKVIKFKKLVISHHDIMFNILQTYNISDGFGTGVINFSIFFWVWCTGLTAGAVCVYPSRVGDCKKAMSTMESKVPIASGTNFYCSTNFIFHHISYNTVQIDEICKLNGAVVLPFSKHCWRNSFTFCKVLLLFSLQVPLSSFLSLNMNLSVSLCLSVCLSVSLSLSLSLSKAYLFFNLFCRSAMYSRTTEE